MSPPERAVHRPYAGMNVGVYTRASDDAKKRGSSVGEQGNLGLRWVDEQGAVHFRTYCDNDRSASRFAIKDREDFAELLADVRAGRLDIIWFFTLSRSQRRLRVFAELRDACRDHGLLWVVSGRVYDLNDRGDRLALGISALMDEDLPEQISLNTRTGIAGSAAKGRPHAPTLYGYRRIYDQDTGELVAQEIREDQAAVVREAARRLLAGESMYAITEALNAAGHRAPKGGEWHRAHIRRMLLRPSYIGKRTHHGVVVADGIWPAILDEPTFYACRKVLTDPARAIRHDTATKHVLSGIAVCDVCKGNLRIQTQHGRPYYVCASNKRCVALRQDWLEDYIHELVFGRLSKKDALKYLAQPERERDAQDATKELKEKRELLQEWYSAGARGDASPKAVGAVEAELLPKIEELKMRAAIQRVSPVLRDAARSDIRKVWPDYSLPRRREIIRELLEIRVVRVGPGYHRGFDKKRVVTKWRHTPSADSVPQEALA